MTSHIADHIRWARREAEALMVTQATFTRPTGETAQNEETGAEDYVYAALFSSRCRVKRNSSMAQEARAGDRIVIEPWLEIHLPVDSPVLRVNDVATITATGYGSDPGLVGKRFRVLGPAEQTWASARRYSVQEVV